MCETALFDHPICGCRWIQVMAPCGAGMGLTTCPALCRIRARANVPGESLPVLKSYSFPPAVARKMRSFAHNYGMALASWPPCPRHALGTYDKNICRLVVRDASGVRFGLGPKKSDAGIDCCVVM